MACSLHSTHAASSWVHLVCFAGGFRSAADATVSHAKVQGGPLEVHCARDAHFDVQVQQLLLSVHESPPAVQDSRSPLAKVWSD